MLKHTRVTGIPDVQRMGAATARPGNDPRTWFSFATVEAVGVDKEGVFVDVILQPTGDFLTCRLGTPYSGPNFGFHIPISIDEEVVVGLPSGDPLHGGVIIGRLQSASDPLPQEAIDHKDDFVLVVQDKKSVRLAVNGDGAKIFLGAVDATRGVARKNDTISVSLSDLQACLDLRYQQLGGTPPPLTLPVNGTISSASDTVVSK